MLEYALDAIVDALAPDHRRSHTMARNHIKDGSMNHVLRFCLVIATLLIATLGVAHAEDKPATITVKGTLKFNELPKTKSVEAYMGKEFTLTDAAGKEHNLKASETVSHDTLKSHDGKTIEVTCVPFEAKAPNPMEAAPMQVGGPKGTSKPMKRPGGCRVTQVVSVSEK